MKAWSVAWNTAHVPLAETSARVIQVRRTGKGCLSYVVGSGNEASKPSFVERVTSRLPPTPPDFARIVQLNEAGEMPADSTELEPGANRCAVR